MRELKQEDPCELELGLELELEADDVEAAVAAVAAASEGQIPCSCCDVLLANAEELHGHQMQQHSLSELSLALITLRGLDLPLVQTEESESPAVFDDSSHLRSILLGQAVDRPHDCDSESTVTVNSEARMFSPSNSPEFVDTSDFKNISMWNNMESLTYSPNSYMEEKNYLNSLENKIEISKPNIGNNSQDSGCWSDYSSQGKRNEPIIAQRKRNKKYDDLDSRQFFCNLCDRRYKKKSHLERHFRVHTGIRPYECHVCQKRFAVRSILKQHIRVHTGERPFSCDICSQRFPQKSGLMTHMMLHNGKPFKCEYCVKSFVSNHKLMLHQRSHGDLVNGAPHQGPYCCPSCDMRFFTAGALAEHAKGHIVGNHPTAHSNAHGADDFTISEEAARTAVSAIGMINDQSPECQSEIPEYIEDALGYDYQSDTLDIVKNEIFEEDDLAPGFLCEARWGGIEDMCI